jgi:hypothetical protein
MFAVVHCLSGSQEQQLFQHDCHHEHNPAPFFPI